MQIQSVIHRDQTSSYTTSSYFSWHTFVVYNYSTKEVTVTEVTMTVTVTVTIDLSAIPWRRICHRAALDWLAPFLFYSIQKTYLIVYYFTIKLYYFMANIHHFLAQTLYSANSLIDLRLF